MTKAKKKPKPKLAKIFIQDRPFILIYSYGPESVVQIKACPNGIQDIKNYNPPTLRTGITNIHY